VDKEALVFAGDVKNPLWIGKAKEADKFLSEEWYCCLDLWTWFESGMYKPNLKEDSMKLCCGIRVITEQRKYGN